MDMFGRQKLAQLKAVLDALEVALEAMLAAMTELHKQQERIEKKLDACMAEISARQRQPVSQGLIPIVAKPQVTKPSLTEVKKNDKSK